MAAWQSINSIIDDFDFVPGVTPLSTWKTPVVRRRPACLCWMSICCQAPLTAGSGLQVAVGSYLAALLLSKAVVWGAGDFRKVSRRPPSPQLCPFPHSV